MVEITEKLIENHITKMVDMLNAVKLHRLSILVGENGCGKSFIRKQLPFRLKDVLGLSDDEMRHIVKAVSMQMRTEPNPFCGAMSTAMLDLPWIPTSLSTYTDIEQLLGCIDGDKEKYYFIIDEPEIGMSEESQMGIANLLKASMPYILDNSYGLMLITHSRIIVETFKDTADFHYLGLSRTGTDVDSWLSRELVPTDFLFLDNWSYGLYKQLNKRMGIGQSE